jgi:hypothetical protein
VMQQHGPLKIDRDSHPRGFLPRLLSQSLFLPVTGMSRLGATSHKQENIKGCSRAVD